MNDETHVKGQSMIHTKELEKLVNFVLSGLLDIENMTPVKALFVLNTARDHVAKTFGVTIEKVVFGPEEKENG